MCLITSQKEPIITDKNLIVYKTLRYDLRSIFYLFHYELNKLYKTEIAIETFREDDENRKAISNGFHSYNIEVRAGTYEIRVECFIPKGSEVYYSTKPFYSNQEEKKVFHLVSNQIIINKIL